MEENIAHKKSLREAESCLRSIFRDNLGLLTSSDIVLTDEEVDTAVNLLQQHPSLVKSKELCRRDKRTKLLPLSALLRYGRDRVSLKNIRLVYNLYPDACFQFQDTPTWHTLGLGKRHGCYEDPLHIAFRYANVEVIEFLFQSCPAVARRRYQGTSEEECFPLRFFILRDREFLASPDVRRKMIPMFDMLPENLFEQRRIRFGDFVRSLFRVLIYQGLVKLAEDIVERCRFPKDFELPSWETRLLGHTDSVKTLAVVLRKLKSFRFHQPIINLRGPDKEKMISLQQVFVDNENLERLEVSWSHSCEVMHDLCLGVLRKHKPLRELRLVASGGDAFNCLKLVEYARVLENDNRWTCVTLSYRCKYEETPQHTTKNKDLLAKIHFYSFWNKHGRQVSNTVPTPGSELVSHLTALENDNAPQLTDEIKMSIAYELLRASPRMCIPNQRQLHPSSAEDTFFGMEWSSLC